MGIHEGQSKVIMLTQFLALSLSLSLCVCVCVRACTCVSLYALPRLSEMQIDNTLQSLELHYHPSILAPTPRASKRHQTVRLDLFLWLSFQHLEFLSANPEKKGRAQPTFFAAQTQVCPTALPGGSLTRVPRTKTSHVTHVRNLPTHHHPYSRGPKTQEAEALPNRQRQSDRYPRQAPTNQPSP